MIKSNRSIQKGNQQDKGFGNGVTLISRETCLLRVFLSWRDLYFFV